METAYEIGYSTVTPLYTRHYGNTIQSSIIDLKPLRHNAHNFKTSYKEDYGKKEKITVTLPRRISPNRMNRPHPTNLYYLERLDAKKVVCNVKSDIKEPTNTIGITKRKNGESMYLKTCTQESFGKHVLPNCINTRYGSNRGKHSPARGIVPIIGKKSCIKENDDHWLPGTLNLTTTMTLQGPFQFLPRKRKQMVVDTSAAGKIGAIPPEEHRYHNYPKCRGLITPRLTIRSGI